MPWWLCLAGFFGGLSLVGVSIDILTSTDLPAALGMPVCAGLATLGMLFAIGSLGVLIEGHRDTDGSPAGRDAQRLDGEAATAGAEGIAQTSATIIGERG